MALTKITGEGVGSVDSITVTNGGSIGTASNDLTIHGDVGIRFSGDDVRPLDSSGAQADNSVDLGHHDVRWQDLYLGGNLYLGGTGSANALDDYETGSATLTYTGDSNPTVVYEQQAAEYVKVGDFVIVCGRLRTSSVSSQGSGGLRLSGLPFTVDTGQIWGSVNIGYGTGWPTGNTPATGYAEPGTTRCDLIKADSDARNGLDTSVSAGSLRTDAGNDIIFTITYKTA